MDGRCEVAMRLMVVVMAVLVASAYPRNLQKDEGEDCQLPQGIPGVCRKMSDCAAVRKNVGNKIFTHERCSFVGFEEVVCCGTAAKIEARTSTTSDEKCKEYQTIMKSFLIPYIIRGEEVTEGEFPHMAALGYQPKKGGEVAWSCGGTLISNQYILTAGHCVLTKTLGKPKFVRLGYIDMVNNEGGTGQQFEVVEDFVHPNYTQDTNYFDIALLKLSKPVPLSVYIFPACLYTKEEDPQTGLTVAGWGDVNGDGISTSRYLLKADLQLVTRAKCQDIYKKQLRLRKGIVADMLCANNPVTKSDTCKGDSGGPLQVPNDDLFSIVGVTSFGPIQCGGPTPGVYTRVASYVSWIESVVWQ